jgi:hypothetical protein
LKHCFYSLKHQKVNGEGKMIRSTHSQNTDAQFAEKCRKALEKSWGVDIPKPKLISKKTNEKEWR